MQKNLLPARPAWWLVALVLGLARPAQAQRVGLVLSGGGAKGLAHIGVLKELEKNHIPIDYIVGTSMGAVVGALYAASYSPAEIEQIALSPDFQDWTSGKRPENKTYNFVTAEPSPSSLRLGLALDSTFKTKVTTNLVNDLNLNLALARLLAPAANRADYDFDKLFVPYRCMASEVFTRQEIIQRKGLLADAVRNSMAFPLAFRPIRNLDGKYYYDGAVFENFPTTAMKKEFKPDIIIGVNVGDVAFKKYPKNDDELLASTVLFLGTSVADTGSVGKNGIYIEPDLDGLGVGDFDQVRSFIAHGDTAARNAMADIKQRIGRRVDTVALAQRREQFRSGLPEPRFVGVEVRGLRPEQNAYAATFFRATRREGTYDLDDIIEGYYQLASDDYFKNIYPRIRYDKERKGYVFTVDAQRNNNVSAEVGFVLATRPLDNFYLGLEYRILRRVLYTASADMSLGRFYNAGHGAFRVSVPGRLPFYVEPNITYNQWNFQNTGGLLGRDVFNTQVRQQDTKLGVQFGISPNYRSQVVVEAAGFLTKDEYSNRQEISSADVLDNTQFQGGTAALRFMRNTLNRKQYATRGHRYVLTARGVLGQSEYTPGTTSVLAASNSHREWVQLRATAEKFFPLPGDNHAWGYFAELMASGQGTFSNYAASITTAPVFAPLPDAHTLFLDSYRQARYVAGGLRYTRPFLKKLEWRTEVYAHLNVTPLERGPDQRAVRQDGVDRPRLTASTGLILNTPVGPLAVHARYYDDPAEGFSIFGHLGFLLFRGRALE